MNPMPTSPLLASAPEGTLGATRFSRRASRRVAGLVLGALLCAPLTSHAATAAGTVEAGAAVGYHWLDSNNQLGDAYYDDNTLASSPGFALRGAYNFGASLGAEAEITFVPTTLRRQERTGRRPSFAPVVGLRLSGLWHVGLLDERLRAFALLGLGNEMLLRARNFRDVDQHDYTEKDADMALSIGGGAKWSLLERVLLRVDLRWTGTAGRYPAGSISHGVTFQVGASYTFGGAPTDTDGDGIADPRDRCPKKPEDRDGFEDQDGCPDPDNDGDGIADADDRCPNKKENRNGIADQDGCPDADTDGDGVMDARDKCPKKPEDKDGFEDEDGCPDLDNDGDGIADGRDTCPDAAEDRDGYEDLDGCPDLDNDADGVPDKRDKCVAEPETANGYRDADGCPDEVPEILIKAFAGPIAGVRFDRGTANLDTRSYKALDRLLALLKEHVSVRIRVTAHVHPSGDPAAEAAITEARAKVVGAYFVNRGVSADRVQTAGKGGSEPLRAGKGARARRKNERVEIRLLARQGSARE